MANLFFLFVAPFLRTAQDSRGTMTLRGELTAQLPLRARLMYEVCLACPSRHLHSSASRLLMYWRIFWLRQRPFGRSFEIASLFERTVPLMGPIPIVALCGACRTWKDRCGAADAARLACAAGEKRPKRIPFSEKT